MQKKINDIPDYSKYNLKATYNFNQSTMSGFNFLLATENSYLVFPMSEKRIVKNGIEIDPALYGYVNDSDEIEFFNKDISKHCTMNEPENCTNTLNAHDLPMYYYCGKLYQISQNYDPSTDLFLFTLQRSDLDGGNLENLYEFEPQKIYDGQSHYSEFIQFHNKKIYISLLDQLYYSSIDSFDFQKVNLDVKGIRKLFFYDDEAYLFVSEYNDKDDAYFKATIVCDLNFENVKVFLDNTNLFFIDEDNYFYLDENDNVNMRSRENGTNKIVATNSAFIFKYNNQYLIDTWILTKDNKMIIINENGDILHEKVYTNEGEHYPQLLTENRLYVYKDNWYGYYEINEQGIGDLIMLPRNK